MSKRILVDLVLRFEKDAVYLEVPPGTEVFDVDT